MNAQSYLETFIRREYVGDCHVVVQHAKRGISVRLKLDQEVPDGDDNYDVFIQCQPLSTQRTDHTEPEAIVDKPTEHNCRNGTVCGDHPEYPSGHNECYGTAIDCPYPDCEHMASKSAVSEVSEIEE